jgi:hypothetical protein
MPAPSNKIIRNTVVTIDAVFGSDIQRDVSMKLLRALLNAWKQNVETGHTKNKVAVRFESKQGA